jgi:hypothetical protein
LGDNIATEFGHFRMKQFAKVVCLDPETTFHHASDDFLSAEIEQDLVS